MAWNRRKPGGRALAVVLTLALTVGWNLHAQNPTEPQPTRPGPEPGAGSGAVSVQDALNRPFRFPFHKPTPLEEVAAHLGRVLNAPVAVDRAALDRLELKMDDPVQLELAGVRLRTGLKLLLDQLDLTFKVIPEDNLLVITDREGTHDPIDDVLAEVKALHREVHDVQDRLDELRSDLGLDAEPGARMRKPTIREEVPAPGPEKPKDAEGVAHPRTRPGF